MTSLASMTCLASMPSLASLLTMVPAPPKKGPSATLHIVVKNEQIKDIISDNYLKKKRNFKKRLSDVLLKEEKKLKKTIIV